MKKILVAALFVVLASPAFAAIQNVKVSGDITTSWVSDNSLNLGTTDGSEDGNSTPTTNYLEAGMKNQSVFLTQTRLRVDADLSDNVSTTVGLINERAWNAESCTGSGVSNANCDTNVQLYLASVTLREMLYSPLTVQVGRQVFNYGNGFILGDGGPINSAAADINNIYADLTERTAYDGVTATLDYKPLTISLIYFKNDQTTNSIEGHGNLQDGQSSDVYGYNANYQLSDPWNTVVEQYMFARINGVGYLATTGVDKGSVMYVPGLRASTNPIKNLNIQGEIAWELGNQDVSSGGAVESERRDAMAGQFLATYSLPILDKYKPTVNASYTYASGDKNSNTNYSADGISSAKTYTAWDEFNTIQGAGTIYRALFNMSNQSIVEAGASFSPLEDVTAGVTWSGLWANTRYDSSQNPLSVLQPNGTTISPATNHNGFWLGNETDLNLTYNYTEDVTFGLTVGWFVPGDVFKNNNDETASQAIANVGVKF